MMISKSHISWVVHGLLVLIFIGSVDMLQAQGLKVRGYVHDESRNPVTNATITFDRKLSTTSDGEGKFEMDFPTGNQPMIIQVEKEGVSYSQTIWGYVNSDDGTAETIKIKVVRTGHFIGRVTNPKGVSVARANVKITGGVDFGPVKTDEDGDFFIKLPAGKKVTSNVNFFVNNYEMPAANCDLNVAAQTVNITYVEKSNSVIQLQQKGIQTTRPAEKETLVYTITLQDSLGEVIPNTPILISNSQYRSDEDGRMLYRGQVPAAELFVPKQGMRRIAVKRDDSRNEVVVILEEIEKVEEVVDLPANKDIYSQQLESIAMGLEKEQLALNARGMELRREIAQLALQLNQERDLTTEKKEEIGEALERLQQTLQENDDEYRRSQERTRELLGKMRHDLDIVTEQNRMMEEKAQQQLVLFMLITAGLLGLVLIFYFISDKMRRQRNELTAVRYMLEEKVEEVRVKNEKILAQTDKLKALNHTISSKSRKITDSISYAQSIQTAVLPSFEVMKHSLKDFFVLYRSKEIVSGDFYWFSKLPCPDGSERLLVAAIDCTGHGIPGGFMSMIAHTLLSDITGQKGICDPQQILTELNEGMRSSLHQDERLMQDGMDIAICSIAYDGDKANITFSGARRPMIYVEKGVKEAHYLKGDKRSIGGLRAADSHASFIKQEIQLHAGSAIYLTSDGFVEQGSQKTGKIGTKQLLEILAEHSHEPMEAQQAALESLLDDYKVNVEQRDDILVFGVRI